MTKGLIGEVPQTLWLFDFPLLAREMTLREAPALQGQLLPAHWHAQKTADS